MPGPSIRMLPPVVSGSAGNRGKLPYHSIYIDRGFNAAIRSYFLRLAGREPSRVAWLDATLDPAELARLTGTRLRHMMAHRHIQGTA